MFSSADYGDGTVLFSNLTTTFKAANSDEPKKWMGNRYHNALKAMDCDPKGEQSFIKHFGSFLNLL